MAKRAQCTLSPRILAWGLLLGALGTSACSGRPDHTQDQGPIDDDDEEDSRDELPDPSGDGDDEESDSKGEDDDSENEDDPEKEEKPKDKEPEPEPGDRALIIKHGWDVPFAGSLPKIEQEIQDSPFDGVVFSAGKTSRIFGPDAVSLQTMKNNLRGLHKIDKNTDSHYYIILYVDAIPGGFTGKGADVLIENAARLGEVLSELPVKGIAFDNEVYKKSPWDMPQACPGLDRKACGQVAFEVGQKMMRALMKSWPDLHFWPFFGPWLNDHRTYDWINKYSLQNDWAEDDDVASEFVAGAFAASTEGPAIFIDGGEFYGLRSRNDFAKTAQWTRTEMVKDSPFFPEEYKDVYAKEMKVGFGIYDDRIHLYTKLPKLNAARWAEVIHSASLESDFVWVYTERHDWWKNDGNDWPDTSKEGTSGPVSQIWRDAARQAVKGKPRLLSK